MAKHIWTVLCREVHSKEESVDLVGVIDGIEIAGPLIDVSAPGDQQPVLGAAVDLKLVSMWRRASEGPDSIEVHVRLLPPREKVEPASEDVGRKPVAFSALRTVLSFEDPSQRSYRSIVAMKTIPVTTSGTYTFLVAQRRVGASEEEKWQLVASVPFDVRILHDDSLTSTPPPTQVSEDEPPFGGPP